MEVQGCGFLSHHLNRNFIKHAAVCSSFKIPVFRRNKDIFRVNKNNLYRYKLQCT